MITRRKLIQTASALAAQAWLWRHAARAQAAPTTPAATTPAASSISQNPAPSNPVIDSSVPLSANFHCEDAALQKAYDAAHALLRGNLMQLPGLEKQVLIEGAVYKGVWMECAPQEGLVYEFFTPGGDKNNIAQNNHDIFFALQRADGMMPCSVKPGGPGWAQIQMVIPIAATAWESYQRSQDAAFLQRAYTACARYDAWLLRFRNTRGTGLIEGFCTYDTGHDNSPRWAGLPRQCPNGNASNPPTAPGLPRLCPDLSASVYGGRVALAAMAKELGKKKEESQWKDQAEVIRGLIIKKLYDPETSSFYDLDPDNKFVKIRGDAMVRVLGEHVVDAVLFEEIYAAQIHNPKAFWPAYPLPSIALDDPAFVRPIPRNSWGGAAQALMALRAPRWMEHYGKPADLTYMMQQWISAITKAGGFYQQMDPLTGGFSVSDGSGYSPCALVLLDYVWRSHGVRPAAEDRIEWNCNGLGLGMNYSAELQMKNGVARLERMGEKSTLKLNGKTCLEVTGECRVITDSTGNAKSLTGTRATVQMIGLGGRKKKFNVQPNVLTPV